MNNAELYAYRVIWSDEDQEHVGLCAEFPSLSWLAETQADALNGIVKLVADVLIDMEKIGETMPTPLSKRAFSGKFQARVPPELHRELAMEAAEQGISLNRLVSRRLSRRANDEPFQKTVMKILVGLDINREVQNRMKAIQESGEAQRELKSLTKERDEAVKERDSLRVELEAVKKRIRALGSAY